MQTFQAIYDRVCQLGPRNSPVRTAIAADQLTTICHELGLGVAADEPFESFGDTYANLVIGPMTGLVLLAHYDTNGPTCGACDNASGVSVALAAASLAVHAGVEVGLVLCACEEPPFYGSVMGSLFWAAKHRAELTNSQILVLDSLGSRKDLGLASAHPSGRTVATRELVILAPADDHQWAVDLGNNLTVQNYVDVSGNPIRRLGDTRNFDGLKAALVLDSTTMGVPFHTVHDIQENVDADWLEEVAVDLFHAAAAAQV